MSFTKNGKQQYIKAIPSAHSTIMDEDVTAQLCNTIPPEVYAKCLSNFHLKGEDIASRYDELISRLKCDNYVEVEKDSPESAPTIMKGHLKVNPCRPAQKKVTFDHLNYYQYDTRPNNNGHNDGNRNNRRPWNNRNHNSDSSPNRGDNSSNNQGATNQNRNANQGHGNRSSLVCTYGHCGLIVYKKDDCRCKADNLHNMAFRDSIVSDVKAVVESEVTQCLKVLGFPPGLGMGS